MGLMSHLAIKRWLAASVALSLAACSDVVLNRSGRAREAGDSEGLSTAIEDVLSTGTRPSPEDFSLLMKQSKPLAGLQVGEVRCADRETVHYFIRRDQSALFFDSPIGQNRSRWADCPPRDHCEVGTASTTVVEHLLGKGEKLPSLEMLRHKFMDGKRLP